MAARVSGGTPNGIQRRPISDEAGCCNIYQRNFLRQSIERVKHAANGRLRPLVVMPENNASRFDHRQRFAGIAFHIRSAMRPVDENQIALSAIGGLVERLAVAEELHNPTFLRGPRIDEIFKAGLLQGDFCRQIAVARIMLIFALHRPVGA